jgi:hypothetical protein
MFGGTIRPFTVSANARLRFVEITLHLPDDLAAPLLAPGREPARAALEAIALEAYRERRITGIQLRRVLGLGSRFELDGFLKEHKIEKYTADDFDRDLATIEEIAKSKPPA